MTATETVIPAPANTTATVTSPIVTDGAQPVVSSPIVEVNPPAPVADPVVDPNAQSAATDEDPNKTPATLPDWAMKRINEVTKQRFDVQRELKASETARLAAEAKAKELLEQISVRAPADPNAPQQPQATKPVITEEEIERRVEEKALQMAAAKQFNDACNNIVEAGKKEFKDWDASLDNLTLVGLIGKGAPIDFLETAIELKNPAAILHHLGKNLDEAERITKLPPKRMAMELARIETQLSAPAPATPTPVSNAPAPVIPVGGAAKVTPGDISDPNMPLDDWYALRAKQIEDRKNRYRRA